MAMKNHVDTYIPHVEAGMTYEEIRALAIENGVHGRELSTLMRELDRSILDRDEGYADRRQARESMWIGIAFCAIAGMMSLYALLESEGHYIYIVYCIFGGGVLVFYNGLQKKKYLEKESKED
jgi:hypothetical protein